METSSRRSFLGKAALAVGGLAAPLVAPSWVLGRSRLRAPSDRVGIGFIGPGHRGSQLVREFAGRGDVEPLAVCDVRREQRESMRALVAELASRSRGGAPYDACRTHVDFRDVLARTDIDAVILSTPEHWRPIQCILAARAGKDVFAEKPFALTLGEAKAMVEAVRRHGRIFQHGTQRRSNNEYRLRDACEMVRSGRIGRVTHAIVPVGPAPLPDFPDGSVRPAPPDPDTFAWDLWLGPAPWRPYPGTPGVAGWQGRRDFGLGSIGNWGSHTLDMAQWALGKDAEGPTEILPATAERPWLVLRYSDGMEIRCPRTPGDATQVSVHGTEGRKIVFGNVKLEERYDPRPIGDGDVRLYRPEGNDHNGDWLRAIRSRRPPICNEEVAYRSGSLCLLISLSDRLRRPLRFDPEACRFLDARGLPDDEANRLVDRPRRSPWRLF